MFTDEVRIKIIAGQGGDGSVAFNKIKMSLGPTGGSGGDGGNIYFKGVSDLTALNKYRHKKEYFAPDGKNGRGNCSDGPNGKDLELTVPAGTLIHNLDTLKDFEIIKPGQKILAAEGGEGGKGNFAFRSSTNTSPQEYEEGELGEESNLFLELRLIADVGLIGLPSAGKSSLLNELTAANAKVAQYHFTTLEPNLGVMNEVIIADIPGLIEGASLGKGLGIKFLRHIQRTKILLHCLSLDSDNILRDYKTVRKELQKFNKELLEKKELILLTKSDLLPEGELRKKIAELKFESKPLPVSIHDWDSIEKLKKEIIKLLR